MACCSRDLRAQIFCCLPLAQLQLWQDSLISFDSYIADFAECRYNISREITHIIMMRKFNRILSLWERFEYIAFLSGDIGYNGQLYIPREVCLIRAIDVANLDLVQYYFYRIAPSEYLLNLAIYFAACSALATRSTELFNWLYSAARQYISVKISPHILDRLGEIFELPYVSSPGQLSPISNLRYALTTFNTSILSSVSPDTPFPPLTIGAVYNEITAGSIIPLEIFNAAPNIRDIVATRFISSSYRDAYLSLLDVLNNETVTTGTSLFTRLAISCTNSATLEYAIPLKMEIHNTFAYSEVLYDPDILLRKNIPGYNVTLYCWLQDLIHPNLLEYNLPTLTNESPEEIILTGYVGPVANAVIAKTLTLWGYSGFTAPNMPQMQMIEYLR